MDSWAKQNRQSRAVAIAIFGSITASVATMFVPVAMLEAVTGATGISEVFRAAAAPLGDTARAMIAFGVGVVTLAVLMVLLMRRDAEPVQDDTSDWTAAGIPESDDDLTPTWKERIAALGLPAFKMPQMPKMPWVKGDDDITELADLPKLRNGDAHPDAPPRRPLFATQDLPTPDPIAASITRGSDEPVKDVAPVSAPGPTTAVPSLDEMVAQLEASVAQRRQQLADLEMVAANLAASKADAVPVAAKAPAEPTPLADPKTEIAAEPARQMRPALEAVPASPPADDDMDAALAAALATLHRMNGTGG